MENNCSSCPHNVNCGKKKKNKNVVWGVITILIIIVVFLIYIIK